MNIVLLLDIETLILFAGGLIECPKAVDHS